MRSNTDGFLQQFFVRRNKIFPFHGAFLLCEQLPRPRFAGPAAFPPTFHIPRQSFAIFPLLHSVAFEFAPTTEKIILNNELIARTIIKSIVLLNMSMYLVCLQGIAVSKGYMTKAASNMFIASCLRKNTLSLEDIHYTSV